MPNCDQKNTIHCPHCGHDVSNEPETEFGIFCPRACGDFQVSETIPGNEFHLYRHVAEYNIMMKR